MLGLFKSLVYAESSTEFDEKKQTLMDSQYVESYPSFGKYMTSVIYDFRDRSICYRHKGGILTRGHNTNNTVEVPFLVMKEGLLQRIKEYNINRLFHKLTYQLESHYIEKLLSDSSGSFDQFLGGQYAGKSVKRGQLGFARPTSDQLFGSMLFRLVSVTYSRYGC